MMQHTEATIQIYFTKDYARFNMINGNRQLNDAKIKKIITEINGGNDMLRYYPIQVRQNKERLDILDGQHRFWISKKLARGVFYILVQEEKSMPDIAKINSNVEKWKNEDFINCYVQHGNSNYQIIREFQDATTQEKENNGNSDLVNTALKHGIYSQGSYSMATKISPVKESLPLVISLKGDNRKAQVIYPIDMANEDWEKVIRIIEAMKDV